jgi:TonB-dependent starch-binding outer membrane protein SusC
MSTTPVAVLTVATALVFMAGCGAHQAKTRPPSDTVAVGYGTQPKDKVTGAVTSLNEKQISTQPLKIEELLRGKVAGLQIVNGPSGPSFRIRGTGSMMIDQEPLVIVDGVQIPTGNLNSALAGLHRDDIKGVTVLKDVASTSIYGGRGAGGVILITTKK